MEELYGKKIFLLRFWYGCEKDLTSNQLTVMIVDTNPVNKEAEVTTISTKPEYEVDL